MQAKKRVSKSQPRRWRKRCTLLLVKAGPIHRAKRGAKMAKGSGRSVSSPLSQALSCQFSQWPSGTRSLGLAEPAGETVGSRSGAGPKAALGAAFRLW